MLAANNLAANTRSTYSTAIEKYKDFMIMIEKNEKCPSEIDIAKWIAYESFFVSPQTVSHYLSGVRYYLSLGGKEIGEVASGGTVRAVKTALFVV